MIDYIKYTIDGKTYDLVNKGDGTWSKDLTAPSVAGDYSLVLEISENGMVTYIDSSDSRYEFYLDVLVSTERVVFLERFVPDFISETDEFGTIYEIEDLQFDKLHAEMEKVKSDMFIKTASNDIITRLENFMRIKGQGTLDQRKSYLISLSQKGNKLSEATIRDITNTITGSDCIIAFFGSNESGNPQSGYGLLQIQVLSPDNSKDYRYADIARALSPLVPEHIKLVVVKYFSTWGDIKNNYASWTTVSAMNNWQAVKDYIAPQ